MNSGARTFGGQVTGLFIALPVKTIEAFKFFVIASASTVTIETLLLLIALVPAKRCRIYLVRIQTS